MVGRLEVNNVRRDEQSERLPVLQLIKAKCFKRGRTKKGQTAARMKDRGKKCMKEGSQEKKKRNLKEIQKKGMIGGKKFKRSEERNLKC